MSRAVLAALALLALGSAARPAHATEQIEERLVVEGRVYRMPAVPLEPLLKQRGKSPLAKWVRASNLWRGYVGTWRLEGDQLYLSSLIRYAYEDGAGGLSRRIAKDIPLSTVFGEQPGPIAATWWSGHLSVPRGRLLKSAWRSRDRLYEKTLYLNVTKGRVSAKRLVDNRKEGRGLSPEDIRWTIQAPQPMGMKAPWHDARTIRSAAFQEAVPSGTAFRTRGLVFGSTRAHASVWVPHTPATDAVRIRLLDLPDRESVPGPTHVELTASWEKDADETVLRVSAVRDLTPRESIHHPTFVVPDLKPSKWQTADEGVDPDGNPVLREPTELHSAFGMYVSLRGQVVAGTPPSIHGVDVAVTEAIAGRLGSAVGQLEKWIVTQDLLDANPEVASLFGKRGPGTYYRLVHPVSGKLARTRLASDE